MRAHLLALHMVFPLLVQINSSIGNVITNNLANSPIELLRQIHITTTKDTKKEGKVRIVSRSGGIVRARSTLQRPARKNRITLGVNCVSKMRGEVPEAKGLEFGARRSLACDRSLSGDFESFKELKEKLESTPERKGPVSEYLDRMQRVFAED